jgi:predicted TIM-barrel fold metal-dependent hydrolase
MRLDCHSHVPGPRLFSGLEVEELIGIADRLQIDQLCCSRPVTSGLPAPDEVRECNDAVWAAMQAFPDRILGYCYVNPGYCREALAEIDRCVDGLGMIGVKLYRQYKANDPVVFPVIEKAIELGVPVLWHAGNQTFLIRGQLTALEKNTSHAGDIAELARRYPEAILIEGHIGGGGDWEWAIRQLRHVPNVYLDTSGSVIDAGMIEMAAAELGVDRLLFGTDMTMEGGVGKILGADLTAAERDQIFAQNMLGILSRRGAHA